jgi:beta-aspartyl-peptidase (threonine type)
VSRGGRTWTLALHGGAGTISREHMDEEREQAYRDALGRALDAGREILVGGGSGLDAVEQTVRTLEDEPLFNAGHGAVFTSDGRIELDASIMDGRTGECGAVIGVTRTRHPVALARAVMEHSPHVMLQGAGADAFSLHAGLDQVEPEWFHTEHRWQQLLQARESDRIILDHDGAAPADAKPGQPTALGTVGAVARDGGGNLAAATSTGGMTNKLWGRVGDSPIIGAGTYASNASCAISATGHGEYFIRTTAARDIAAMMEFGGLDLADAARRKVMEELAGLGGSGGIIGVDRDGRSVFVFNSSGMYRARVSSEAAAEVAIYRD